MSIDYQVAIDIGFELLAAVGKQIWRAIEARDIRTLDRVAAALPSGHPLRSRVALLAAEALAEAGLALPEEPPFRGKIGQG